MVEQGVALRRDIAGALRRLRPDIVVTINFELTWGDGAPLNQADLVRERQFDPAQFLHDIAGFGGVVAGCKYAVIFQRFSAQ